MANAKKKAAVVPSVASELENEALTPADLYDEFLDRLRSAGYADDEIKVTLHRFPKSGSDLEFIEKTTLDQAPPEVIRDRWGPGKYKISFRDRTGYQGTQTLVIAERYNPNGGAVALIPAKDDSFMKEILLAMVVNQKAPAALDVGSLLSGMAAMRPPAPPPPPDVGLMFTTIWAAVNGAVNKGNNIKETLEIIREAQGIGGKDGGDGDSGTLGIVREIGKGLSGLFSGGSRQATPDDTSGGRPVAGELAAGSEAETMQHWIVTQIRFLKEKARAGKPFEPWVEYILDNQEEPGCRAVAMALESGATFDNLLAVDPEIKQNPILSAFFRGLYDGLHREIFPADDPGRPAGDAGNAAGDAEPIAPVVAASDKPSGGPKKKRAH